MSIAAGTANRKSTTGGACRRPRRAVVRAAALLLATLVLAVGCDRRLTSRKPERVIGNHGVGPGEFVFPRAVATGPDGCVYVVDKTARIQRFSPDGEYEFGWRMPEWDKGKPTGLMVDAQNHVWVADTHYARVVIYDRDGKELEHFGAEGEGPGQFIFPTHTAIGPDGTRYVSEYGGNDRISRFTPAWEYLGSFGDRNAGPAALVRPQAMAMDADGTLWVADACSHRICHYDGGGALLGAFGTMGSEPGQLKYPYGLALCPDGTLLVCEFGNNRIQRFDRSGKSLEAWGSAGAGPGQLAEPWGVAVGRDGRVYVVDYRNHRVQMFRMS